MKDEKKDRNEEVVNTIPEVQESGDIDDYIFGDESYRCSER